MSVNMTLALPEELHALMRQYPQVKWAEVARRAFQQEVDRMQILDQLLSGSKLTEEDAVALGRKIRHAAAKRAASARAAHARKEQPNRRERSGGT